MPLQLQVIHSDKAIHVELRPSASVPRTAEVYFAIAEDSVESKVSAGENGGHMLRHTAVVRSLTKGSKLSTSGDSGVSMDLKTNQHWGKHLRVIAFLTDREGGKILGATMAEVAPIQEISAKGE